MFKQSVPSGQPRSLRSAAESKVDGKNMVGDPEQLPLPKIDAPLTGETKAPGSSLDPKPFR